MDSIKGFPGGASGKEPTCQCRGPRFDPQGWEEPLEKEMEPTPVFLPGESRGRPGGLQSTGSQESDTTEAT